VVYGAFNLKSETNRGFILPLAIFAALAVASFIMTVTMMSRESRNQMIHMNKEQNAFLIAYSAYSKVLAKISINPWSDRYYKKGYPTENQIKLFGAEYDCYVTDSPGKPNQADIYVRVKLGELIRLYGTSTGTGS